MVGILLLTGITTPQASPAAALQRGGGAVVLQAATEAAEAAAWAAQCCRRPRWRPRPPLSHHHRHPAPAPCPDLPPPLPPHARAQKCAEAGQTPVHAAAREGYLDVLQYLYGAGFDMAGADGEGKTPLHHAPIGHGQAALAPTRGVDHLQVGGWRGVGGVGGWVDHLQVEWWVGGWVWTTCRWVGGMAWVAGWLGWVGGWLDWMGGGGASP